MQTSRMQFSHFARREISFFFFLFPFPSSAFYFILECHAALGIPTRSRSAVTLQQCRRARRTVSYQPYRASRTGYCIRRAPARSSPPSLAASSSAGTMKLSWCGRRRSSLSLLSVSICLCPRPSARLALPACMHAYPTVTDFIPYPACVVVERLCRRPPGLEF